MQRCGGRRPQAAGARKEDSLLPRAVCSFEGGLPLAALQEAVRLACSSSPPSLLVPLLTHHPSPLSSTALLPLLPFSRDFVLRSNNLNLTPRLICYIYCFSCVCVVISVLIGVLVAIVGG